MKKNLLLIIVFLFGFNAIQSQVLIDHKGNRNQTLSRQGIEECL